MKITDIKIINYEELRSEKPDIIIDTLIGYSLKGELDVNISNIINWTKRHSSVKIALDVPSGINATTGETTKIYFKPEYTLTLALPKTGLLPGLIGNLYLGDIGISRYVYTKLGLKYNNPFKKKFLVKITPLI